MAQGHPVYYVDALASECAFTGNQAAVVLPKDGSSGFPSDSWCQSVAAELNLSETCFPVPTGTSPSHFGLRWFTPTTALLCVSNLEVPLCGHATLAAAAVLMHRDTSLQIVYFATASGELVVEKCNDTPGRPNYKARGSCFKMQLPLARPTRILPPPFAQQESFDAAQQPAAAQALLRACVGEGVQVTDAVYDENLKYLMLRVFDSISHQQVVHALKGITPDFQGMLDAADQEHISGVIVTCAGGRCYDFFSRFFGPWMGITEDPVTGSAHCLLAPYWMEQLYEGSDPSLQLAQQGILACRQCSERGGEMTCRVDSDRVSISGLAVIVLSGTLHL